MGNNSSKKVRYDKTIKHALDQETEFAERLARDRKVFNGTQYAETLHSKGAFLLAVYAKLSSSAVHLYKISHRSWIQQPRGKKSAQRPVTEEQRMLDTELARTTAEWRNADAAANWLLRDYDISFRTIMLGMPTNMSEHKDWDQQSRMREQENLAGETERLKTEALNVGFKYLDRNHSGFLEPSDIPDLPASVWARLDSNGKHNLSWNDTISAIRNIEKNLYNLRTEIARLFDRLSSQQAASDRTTDFNEKSKIDADILSTREQYNAAVTEANNEERALVRIYDLFRQAFIQNVFDVIPFSDRTEPLPALSQAVKETRHEQVVQAPKNIEPWVNRIGADIIHPTAPHTKPNIMPTLATEKTVLDIPVAALTIEETNTRQPQLVNQQLMVNQPLETSNVMPSNNRGSFSGSNTQGPQMVNQPLETSNVTPNSNRGSFSVSSTPENRARNISSDSGNVEFGNQKAASVGNPGVAKTVQMEQTKAIFKPNGDETVEKISVRSVNPPVVNS